MRPEKASVVEELQTKLNGSPFLFVTDYTGLRVDQFSELRTRLAGAGARCHVVKNTYLRRAAKEAGLPELGDLKGQTAIIVGDKDVAAAAKVVKSFAAEFQKPTVKLGVIDKAVVSSDQIKAIADLPTREVLLSQLLGVLQAPASKLVRTLNEPASALARLIQAYADKGGGVPDAPSKAPVPASESAPAPETAAPIPAAESVSAPAAAESAAPTAVPAAPAAEPAAPAAEPAAPAAEPSAPAAAPEAAAE